MEMCRVCLSTEKGMQQLDETFVIQYNLLTNLNISLMDGMPQLTCKTCFETVRYFKEFREKSISSEATLRDIISSNVKSEDENIFTKCDAQEYFKSGDDKLNSPIKFEIKEENDVTGLDNFDYQLEEYEEYIVKDESETTTITDIKPKKFKRRKNKRAKEKYTTDAIEKNIHDGSWLCGVCPKTFEDESDLNKHIDVHKDDKQCELCKEKVNSLSQLLAHRLTHVPPKQMKCHICKKYYRSSLYLEYHYRNVHIQHDDAKLSCIICLSSFVTPKKMSSHIRHVHSSVQFFCDLCSKSFPSKASLKSHIKGHSEIKSYVCDLCGFSCNFSSGLRDHKVRRHSQKKINCKNCTRAFPSQQAFDNHKCKKKLRICTICGLQLAGSNRLSSHMARHSSVAKFACSRCPARYKSRAALTVHTNKHDGNRTEQCEYCPAKFYSATVLIKHRRIHTGEKPYVCKICNKGFTGNHNLKVHMKVHGEYLIVKKNNEPDLNNVTI